MKKIDKSKFTDVYKLVKNTDYFIYIEIGGRGIGKTYSTLLGTYLDHKRIMYVRRTDTEVKNCCDAFTNPYKSINNDYGFKIEIKANKDNNLILDYTDSDEPVLIGYANALSTFGKFRGADFSDVDVIVFDEFINTSPVNTIKDDASLLFNLLETVGRNRELLGKEPLKVILLSNANTIDSGIIRSLNLGDIIRQMKIEDIETYTDEDRGIHLSLLKNADIKDLKEKTRLYRLTKGTRFNEMALNNEFTSDFFNDVGKVLYRELIPICAYEDIYFYKHKSKDIIFASKRKADCIKYTEHTLKSFKRDFGFNFQLFLDSGAMLFSDYNVKMDVYDIF